MRAISGRVLKALSTKTLGALLTRQSVIASARVLVRPAVDCQVPEELPGAKQHQDNLPSPMVTSRELHGSLGEHVERVARIALPEHDLAADVPPLYRNGARLVQQVQNLPALEPDAGVTNLQCIVDGVVRTRPTHDGRRKNGHAGTSFAHESPHKKASRDDPRMNWR